MELQEGSRGTSVAYYHDMLSDVEKQTPKSKPMPIVAKEKDENNMPAYKNSCHYWQWGADGLLSAEVV